MKEYALVEKIGHDVFYEVVLRDRDELAQYKKHESIDVFAHYTKEEVIKSYIDINELIEMSNYPEVLILRSEMIDDYFESLLTEDELSERAYEHAMDIKMDAERLGE